MERRITALENRIDRRLRDVEFDVEQKLDRIERAALSAREARGRK
jgi:t-SNARE complex subunit (syntaxin)